MEEQERIYFISLIGDKGIGKTSAIKSFMQEEKSNTNIDQKNMLIDEKIPVKLIIPEIDGNTLNEESYKMLKNSDAIYMVCDITKRSSFMNIKKKYCSVCKRNRKKGALISILTTKHDLMQTEAQYSFDDIDIFSDKEDLNPFNSSCTIKNPKMINNCFEKIGRVLYNSEKLKGNFDKENEEFKEKKEELKNKNKKSKNCLVF